LIETSFRIRKSLNSLIEAESILNSFALDDDDWKNLGIVLRILKPFKMATLDLSNDKRIMSGSLYIITTTLRSHIESCLTKLDYFEFHCGLDKMKEKFDKYWSDLDEYSLVCHILDPRFKYSFLSARVAKTEATKTLKKFYKITNDNNSANLITNNLLS
jgi:hypothetical protein